MKVTEETVTVLPDPALDEINIVLAGLCITLSADEALLLAHALAGGLERLQGMPEDAAAAETWLAGPLPFAPDPGRHAIGKQAVAEPETTRQRTRALIRASIRDKGLSLRAEQRE